jgi:hypothetical protein
MRHTIAIIALALITGGCTTEIVNQFHGEVCNIKGDNKTEALRSEVTGDCGGPAAGEGRFAAFGMPSNGFSLVLFYPRISTRERLATNTVPPAVDAWLVRSDWYIDCSQLIESQGDREVLRSVGGEQLSGRIVARYRNNGDYNVLVDLTGNNGSATSVRGEFAGYTRTKFDPRAIFFGLGMMFFGERHSPTPEPTNSPAKVSGQK